MEREKKVILFTGDSITDGNRYKKKEQEWDLNHQMGHSYAYIINGLLGAGYPHMGFKFQNRGISGNRIADLHARSETDLFPLKPDILSVLVGVNDGPGSNNHGNGTPPEQFEETYRLFLDEIKQKLPECKLILLEPFVCNAGNLKQEYMVWRECIDGFRKIVKNLAEDYEAIFVPLQEVFDKKCGEVYPEYWSWDGVHPTENGHGLIAMEWMKAAGKLLGLTDAN